MLLLIVDTSDREGSIALVRCESGSGCEVLQSVQLAGGTFSAQLVPEFAAMLAKSGLDRHDIEAFVVVSGPGSFTGLRIGLGAIKGLAEALQKPIAAVSLLHAIAEASGFQGRVISALDAGRGQFYAGDFEIQAGGTRSLGERLLSRDELLSFASGVSLVSPDNILPAEPPEVRAAFKRIDRPSAPVIARIGWQKILAGEAVSPSELDTNYVRKSDDEMFARTVS